VNPPSSPTPKLSRDVTLLCCVAAAKLGIHFLLNGRYGYWIDELYFIACGEHLAWGYVDQPPLIAVIAKMSRVLLGDSLFAIRFFPALAGAGLVFLTGWMARELGGRRFAQLLAGIAVIVVPVYLAFNNLLTMNAFEPLFWTACAYLVLLIIKDGNPRWWLVVGLVAGIGFLNKYSMAFFGVSLIAGLLLTPQRRVLMHRWVYLAALVGGVIAFPNLWWELEGGWPTVELLRNAKLYQHQPVSPLEFVWGQVQLMHPFTLPVWIAGLAFYLFAGEAQQFRCLGWTFVILFLVSMVTEAKTYYLAPIYPMLLAAGAVATERFIDGRGWRWLKPASVVFLFAGGALLAPYALPVLPIEMVPRYLSWLGIKEVRPERRAMGNVPQLFADMFGWEETVAAVAKVYDRLPPDEKSRCAIWGSGYGEAAAVDYFGRAYHLPRAISGHQNYYLWGPGPSSGDVVITVNIPGELLTPWFERVELTATVDCPYCMPDRMKAPIHLCRGLKEPWKDFWPAVKCWTCDKPAFAQ
jgi:4-amino-4-deoxy-L-arabinose transferase-like glycosyltransferase